MQVDGLPHEAIVGQKKLHTTEYHSKCICSRPKAHHIESALLYLHHRDDSFIQFQMLNTVWNFLFRSETTTYQPLQRPRKYPRTTDAVQPYIPPHDTQAEQYSETSKRWQAQQYPQQYPQPAPYFQPSLQHMPIPLQNQLNHSMYYNPSPVPNFNMHPAQYAMGYQPFAAMTPNNWQQNLPQFQTQFSPNPVPQYFLPPNYPPPGYSGSIPPVSRVPPAAESFGSDHSDLSVLDWPTGIIRRERVKGQDERKWKSNKWVWRSTGNAMHEGHTAEVRTCLGVYRCGSCARLTRPKTQPAARLAQLTTGCTSCTCSLEAPLIHDKCEARSFHYNVDRNGQTILVWEHFGDHSTHAKPPGGTPSKFQEDQVDVQVLRKHEAGAHELRTGDTAPGSVPFPDISPGLAKPNAARYALAQSQARVGIGKALLKGGLATIRSVGDLQTRLPTPFIVSSSLNSPAHITMQTPFMDDIIRECVESWILDLADGPTAGRHGFVIDGDHSYFQLGTLLATCAYSMTTNEWTPILYSWLNHQDTAHHRPHFAHIFQAVIKHAGAHFSRKLLLCVMDFSGAQRAAHAEEYADAIVSITPGFRLLSPEAQAAERRQLVLEAEAAEVGCDVHFWRSADRIIKTHSLVPPASASTFEHSIREMLSPNTSSDRFDELVLELKRAFPQTKSWLSWWERRPIASMVFPAKSAVTPELAAKVPSTSNPIEHQHSLLHHAVGKDQELLPGLEKLYLHVREMEKKYQAIKDGHFDAVDPKDRKPRKARVFESNDGRAPDTIAALAAADSAFVFGASTLPTALLTHLPAAPFSVSHSSQLLKSYKWDSPNSCFFDNGMEIWFRAFSRWSTVEQAKFLTSLPPNSALADFFYHFQRRLRWLASPSPADVAGGRELGLGQAKARHAIFTRWGLYQNPKYFTTAIPRISIGNDEGGTTVVHSLPAPHCDEPHCKCPIALDAIDTIWPKILHINPETGVYGRLPIARSLSIDDGLGKSILYELIGTISFDAKRSHWTSKFLIDDIAFDYDDLAGGSLAARGPSEFITIPDRTAVLWAYHRTSDVTESRRPFQETVVAYETAYLKDLSRPLTPPIEIDTPKIPKLGLPSTSAPPSAPQLPKPKPIPSYNLAPFPIGGPPLPSLLLDPSEWCSECHQICDHALGSAPVVKCTECAFQYHVQCASDASPYLEPDWDAWVCTRCQVFDPTPAPVWSDALMGTYVMFQTRPQSSFYPARVAGLTSSSAVRMEWYPDNIYTRAERPLESEFVTTQQDCASKAALDDLTYNSNNVGLIKWPSRLAEDAEELHGYMNPELSQALLGARKSVIGIIVGTVSHPIGPDYDQWMKSAGELKQEKRASGFSHTFFNTRILPGDASLIEPHTEYVLKTIQLHVGLEGDGDHDADGLSMEMRRRVITLAPILFQLVIFRIYLGRSSTDDVQIYFLTRVFNKQELEEIAAGDPLSDAKRGKVVRNLTVPEIVLQSAETPSEDGMLYKWCKIGTRTTKAANARIPASFALANAFDARGQVYLWMASNIPGILDEPVDSLLDVQIPVASSSLSELPIEVEMELDQLVEKTSPLTDETDNRKRKREQEDLHELASCASREGVSDYGPDFPAAIRDHIYNWTRTTGAQETIPDSRHLELGQSSMSRASKVRFAKRGKSKVKLAPRKEAAIKVQVNGYKLLFADSSHLTRSGRSRAAGMWSEVF
ncbi:hypothetical protein B0H19DRAFT_1066129 [Mycena capillaripes]|nr:hypothetical protein B0H19DRAFT_1066129 [Mycena capillaripes]